MVERVTNHPPIPPLDQDPGVKVEREPHGLYIVVGVVAFLALMGVMFRLEYRESNFEYDVKCVAESGEISFEGIATKLRGNNPWKFRDAKTGARVETDTHCIFIRRLQ